MGAKFKIQTVVNEDIKNRIAELMKITGHSESKQTKIALERGIEVEEKLKKLSK